jgi:hypothetical protein
MSVSTKAKAQDEVMNRRWHKRMLRAKGANRKMKEGT